MTNVRVALSGRRYSKPLLLVVAGILLIGTAQAITTLQIPQTVIPSPSAVTVAPCGGSLVLTNPPAAGSGVLRYDCGGSSHAAAFSVTSAGSDTATFNPPASITSVGYVSNSAGSCTGFTVLTSGSSVVLATGHYDVCASYSCPSGCTIAAWTFQWLS
jgi:hypothetical protein